MVTEETLKTHEMELESRIRNLVWTVSGDYTLKLNPDVERYAKEPDTVLYDTIRQGAFSCYFDREAYSLYLVKKVYSGAAEGELMMLAQLVTEEARDYGAKILPVDSEHSALFQSLEGCRDRGGVKRLILTCSGGPFYGRTASELKGMTREDALQHPNWSMGAKITIDSATLMNKGLEFIEAMRLYHMPPEKISIVIHRESIIHSLVEYCDHAVLAQLGVPDMRLPIQYALTWPARTPAVAEPLDLLTCPPLTFHAPDYEAFPCLKLALSAARTGGTATAVLNGANEAAVGLFLEEKISFGAIAERVARALDQVPVVYDPTLEDVLAADAAAREAATC